LVDDIAYTYEGIFSRNSIAQAVADAREALEPTATIPDFLPILVSRFAQERLTAAAQADGRLIKPVPELLFVCVQNAGRSQMAAALAQHLSAGKVHVRSAGCNPPTRSTQWLCKSSPSAASPSPRRTRNP
jgi:arsenate reductase